MFANLLLQQPNRSQQAASGVQRVMLASCEVTDRNLRDRDLVKISRRDLHQKLRDRDSRLEVRDRDSRRQNLCIFPLFFNKMLPSLLTMGVRRGASKTGIP